MLLGVVLAVTTAAALDERPCDSSLSLQFFSARGNAVAQTAHPVFLAPQGAGAVHGNVSDAEMVVPSACRARGLVVSTTGGAGPWACALILGGRWTELQCTTRPLTGQCSSADSEHVELSAFDLVAVGCMVKELNQTAAVVAVAPLHVGWTCRVPCMRGGQP